VVGTLQAIGFGIDAPLAQGGQFVRAGVDEGGEFGLFAVVFGFWSVPYGQVDAADSDLQRR